MDRTATAIAVAVTILLMAGLLGEGPEGRTSAPPRPSGQAAPPGYAYYQVRPGETLFRIARQHGTTVEFLAQLNGLPDPHTLQAGQLLLVPVPAAVPPASSPGSAAPAGPAPAPGTGQGPSAPAAPPSPAPWPALSERAYARAAMEPSRPGSPGPLPGGLREAPGRLDELDLLARIIWLEARGEPFEGQVAVGAVVLNRVASPAFPDSVAEVLAQPGQFGFSMAEILAATPGPTAYEAAARALAGDDPTGGALFFYNPDKTRTPEFWATRPVLRRIGNHVFTR